MAYGIESLEGAKREVMRRVRARIGQGLVEDAEVIRYPTLFVLVREDNPEAVNLVGSYGYWNKETGHYIDIIFCGWSCEETQALGSISNGVGAVTGFSLDYYTKCQDDLRKISKWKPSGDIDLLYVDFLCEPDLNNGDFDFSCAVPLLIGIMAKKDKVASVQVLLQNIVNLARDSYNEGTPGSMLETSNKLLFKKIGAKILQWFSRAYCKDAGEVYEELKLYTPRDMTLARVQP
ncbi:MAG: hypothetical protein ACRDS0_15765 [Pseudonocardiaceae bacterium]